MGRRPWLPWDHWGPYRIGPSPLWGHRGARLIATGVTATQGALGALATLGPPRPPVLWCGDLRRYGTTQGRSALGRGPSPLWDHLGPCYSWVGASATGTTGAHATLLWGPLLLSDNHGSHHWEHRPPPLRDHQGRCRNITGGGGGIRPGPQKTRPTTGRFGQPSARTCAWEGGDDETRDTQHI